MHCVYCEYFRKWKVIRLASPASSWVSTTATRNNEQLSVCCQCLCYYYSWLAFVCLHKSKRAILSNLIDQIHTNIPNTSSIFWLTLSCYLCLCVQMRPVIDTHAWQFIFHYSIRCAFFCVLFLLFTLRCSLSLPLPPSIFTTTSNITSVTCFRLTA